MILHFFYKTQILSLLIYNYYHDKIALTKMMMMIMMMMMMMMMIRRIITGLCGIVRLHILD